MAAIAAVLAANQPCPQPAQRIDCPTGFKEVGLTRYELAHFGQVMNIGESGQNELRWQRS
ncbi:MAG TPA: hypothetical protein VH684_15155 [Xanthobacteraceae bacterium]|jgi:hypothetical protein